MPLTLRESICRARPLPRNDEILMGRAELLKPQDRYVVEAVLVRNQPIRAIACMMGVSRRSVRNRVNRLGKRLASRGFLDAARALPYLSDEDARLAQMRLGMSSHVLRRRLDCISAQIAIIRRIRKSRGALARFGTQKDGDR